MLTSPIPTNQTNVEAKNTKGLGILAGGTSCIGFTQGLLWPAGCEANRQGILHEGTSDTPVC